MTLTTAPLSAAAAGAGGARGASEIEIRRAAEEFEGVFIAQIMSQLGASFGVPGPASESGENPFASMLRDEYAKIISRSGGIGIAEGVMRELLRAQEVA